MKKRTIIIVSLVGVILGTIAFVVYKKRKEKLATENNDIPGSDTKIIPEPETPKPKTDKVVPETAQQIKFRRDNAWRDAISTAKKVGSPTFIFEGKLYSMTTFKPQGSTGDMAIGKMAYPLGESAKVRSEPRTADGAFDNTYLGKVNSPNVIGKIKNTTFGEKKMRWYEVTLLTPLSDTKNSGQFAKTGWVREDIIKIV